MIGNRKIDIIKYFILIVFSKTHFKTLVITDFVQRDIVDLFWFSCFSILLFSDINKFKAIRPFDFKIDENSVELKPLGFFTRGEGGEGWGKNLIGFLLEIFDTF